MSSKKVLSPVNKNRTCLRQAGSIHISIFKKNRHYFYHITYYYALSIDS